MGGKHGQHNRHGGVGRTKFIVINRRDCKGPSELVGLEGEAPKLGLVVTNAGACCACIIIIRVSLQRWGPMAQRCARACVRVCVAAAPSNTVKSTVARPKRPSVRTTHATMVSFWRTTQRATGLMNQQHQTKPQQPIHVERVHPHLEAIKVWELKVKDTGAQVNVPGLLHNKVRERSRGMHNARIWRSNVVGWIFGWENKLLPLDGTHNGELSSLSAHT